MFKQFVIDNPEQPIIESIQKACGSRAFSSLQKNIKSASGYEHFFTTFNETYTGVKLCQVINNNLIDEHPERDYDALTLDLSYPCSDDVIELGYTFKNWNPILRQYKTNSLLFTSNIERSSKRYRVIPSLEFNTLDIESVLNSSSDEFLFEYSLNSSNHNLSKDTILSIHEDVQYFYPIMKMALEKKS